MFSHPKTATAHGVLQIESFKDGVQQNTYLETLRWLSPTLGLITPLGEGKSEGGSVTDSTMDFSSAYKNRAGTQTHYTLSIRWSTGKYLEDFSSTDEHGKFVGMTQLGRCLQLH
jgi:hypothetical protein